MTAPRELTRRTTRVRLRQQAGAQLRTETHEGREYLVAPVVMLVEGVHNGELVRAKTLAASVPAWNGRPILLDHPDLVGGVPVSANTPSVLADQQIGLVFDARMDGDGSRLLAEAWLDLEKIAEMGGDAERVLNAIREQEPVEVSTGYYAQINQERGDFGGESYAGVQTFLQADHLAILTDQDGACDWGDGCGIPRAMGQTDDPNQGGADMTWKEKLNELKSRLEEALNWKIEDGDDVPGDVVPETRDVQACQCCGGDHEAVELRQHVDDRGETRLVGACPETQGPIVLADDAGCGCDDVPDDQRIKVNGATLAQALKQMFSEREAATGRTRDQLISRIAAAAEVRRNVVTDFVEGGVDFPSERLLTATALVLDKREFDIWMAAEVDSAKYRRPPQPPVVITPNSQGQEDTMTREQVVDALCLNTSLGITDEVKAELMALEKDEDFFARVAELEAGPAQNDADPPPADPPAAADPPPSDPPAAADPPPADPPAQLSREEKDLQDQQATQLAEIKRERKEPHGQARRERLHEGGARGPEPRQPAQVRRTAQLRVHAELLRGPTGPVPRHRQRRRRRGDARPGTLPAGQGAHRGAGPAGGLRRGDTKVGALHGGGPLTFNARSGGIVKCLFGPSSSRGTRSSGRPWPTRGSRPVT